MTRISAIVVNYNAGDDLIACLRALAAQTVVDVEILIFDNASRDGSFERARAAFDDPRFRFVAVGENLGFAATNNRAACDASGTWLAFVNPDAFLAPDWMARVLECASRHPRAASIAGLQTVVDVPGLLDGAGDRYLAYGVPWRDLHGLPTADFVGGEREIFSACAAAALVDRRRFLDVGGFDDRFFCYCEDVDLGFRLRLAGWTAMLCPEAHAAHRGGGAGGGGDFARYHGLRNLIWTYAKNMPGVAFAASLPGFAAVLAAFLLGSALRGRPHLAWRALADGLSQWRVFRREGAALRARAPAGLHVAFDWNPLTLLRRRRTC